MKHSLLLIVVFFILFSPITAQTVDSIKVEQAGDFIKIRYQILNSNPDQVYRVKVLCSMDGGMNYEIRSISGDVGEQVHGGEKEYWVVWDVLKDVEELKSVEFIVRAELIKESPAIVSKKEGTRNEFHLQIMGDGPPGTWGPRFGYSGKWGLSVGYTIGKDPEVGKYVSHYRIDITKRLVNHEIFKMHLFSGLAFAGIRVRHGYPEDYIKEFFGIDAGLILNIKRFSMSIQCSYFGDAGRLELGEEIDHYAYGIGLGIRF